MSIGTKIAAALVKAQGEFIAIPKGSTNPFFKSKYAALPDVVQAATPVLTANGLAVAQLMTSVDGQDALTTVLIHESGETLESTMLLHLVKDDPQAQGSAVTYARRYSYMSILGLVADVDDDGEKATRPGIGKPRAELTPFKAEKNTSIDKLRAELSKKFSVPSERKAFITSIVGKPATATEMTEDEIQKALKGLETYEQGDLDL